MAQPTRTRSSRRWLSLATAAMVTAACAPQFAAPGTPTTANGSAEGRVSADAFGNTHIQLGGRNFVLKPVDGKPMGALGIQVGGKLYNTVGGAFQLPDAALKDLQANSHGLFRVFAPGYVPVQVWIGQQGDEVALVPMLAAKIQPVPFTGAAIKVPEKGMTVNIPPGLMKKPSTDVQISTYVPAPRNNPAQVQASMARRDDFMAQLAKMTGGAKPYVLAQAAPAAVVGGNTTCANPEQPLPCPPPTAGLGIMMTVNGPLQSGVISNELDLDAAAQDPTRADAVARILQTFKQIDADPRGGAIRNLLANQYGIRLDGHLLTFAVQLGANATTDGFAKVEVQGLDLLGVNMEFTAVSAIGDTLPPGASTPGLIALSGASAPVPATTGAVLPAATASLASMAGQRLISQDGGSLISQDGGSLIGQDGAGIVPIGSNLISQDGGGLIGQDGAGLISQDGGGLISQDGGSLISQDGGSLISQDGGSLLGLNAGSLISQDGGSLVGHVSAPFAAPGLAKFGLLSYTDYPWPEQALVRAVTFTGQPLSKWVKTDKDSNYIIYLLPKAPLYFFVEAKLGDSYIERAVAMAPGKGGQREVDLTAATTAVSTAVYSGLLQTLLNALKLTLPHLQTDINIAYALMDQQTAQNIVQMPIGQVTTATWNLFNAAHIVPRSFSPTVLGGPPAGPSPAPSAAPAPAAGGYLLFAKGAGGINFSGGGNNSFLGSIHSESSIGFSGGGGNSVTGKSEYATTYNAKGAMNWQQKAAGSVTAPALTAPNTFVVDATGDINLDTYLVGTTLPTGVYRTTGNITCSKKGVTGKVTLIGQNVTFTGGGSRNLSSFTQGILIYAQGAVTFQGGGSDQCTGLIVGSSITHGGGGSNIFKRSTVVPPPAPTPAPSAAPSTAPSPADEEDDNDDDGGDD